MTNAPLRLARLHNKAEGVGKPNVDTAQNFILQLFDALHNDPSDIVRHEAAFLIGDLQKQKRIPEELDAFNGLIAALKKDLSVLVVHEIALALANFPGEETIEELVKASKKWAASEVSSSAIYALTDMLNRSKE